MATVITYAARRYLASTVRVQGPSAVSGGHEGGFKIWRNMTFFVAFPSIVLAAANCIMAHNEEGHTRPEFIKYDYLRIRSKRFPWGDGNRSLFHNPHANALPDGYEEH